MTEAGPFWVEVARDVLMVEGPDAQTYLHSQVSQEVLGLQVGQAVPSLVLEPTGRVHSLVRILRSGDHAMVVDVDAGYGDALAARLGRFKIRVRADIRAIPWRCLALRGAGVDQAVAAPGAIAVPAWWGDGTAVDFLGPSPVAPAGLRHGSLDELELARVRAVWPAMGAEITERTLPAELGLQRVAVSFTKGCYPGQELVERMDARGATAPRVLQQVPAAGRRVGDPVVVEGIEVGTITSVAGNLALALVRRSSASPGQEPDDSASA